MSQNDNYDFYRVGKIDKETQKLINQMSSTFFNMFPNENEFLVEKHLEKLPRKYREILFLYYGLDGVHCLDYDEIADKYDISVDDVDEILENGISMLKKAIGVKGQEVKEERNNRYNQLISIYGEGKVVNAFLKLDYDKKELLRDYYGIERAALSKDALEKKYGIEYSGFNKIVNASIRRIKRYINEKRDIRIMNANFYNSFEGYSKHQVNEALKVLSDNHRKIIELYYGLKGKLLTKVEIAAQLGVSHTAVRRTLRFDICKIQDILANPDKFLDDREKFYKMFDAYTKEQVDKAMMKLPERNRTYVELYYGLKGEQITLSEIAKRYNANLSTVSNIIRNIGSRINKILKTEIEPVEILFPRNTKLNELVNKYGEENVRAILSGFSATEKLFFEMYYVANDSMKNISKSIGISEEKLGSYGIKLLEKMEDLLKIKLVDARKREFKRIVSNKNAKEALSKLNKEEMDFFAMYFGLDGSDIQSIEELSDNLRISKKTIEETLQDILDKINKYIVSGGR